MLFVRGFSNKQNKPCTTVAWVPHPTGFFSGEYRFATFDSSPLSFRSERSENPESRSIVPNLVLKPAGDLDPGSNLGWQKNYFFFEPWQTRKKLSLPQNGEPGNM